MGTHALERSPWRAQPPALFICLIRATSTAFCKFAWLLWQSGATAGARRRLLKRWPGTGRPNLDPPAGCSQGSDRALVRQPSCRRPLRCAAPEQRQGCVQRRQPLHSRCAHTQHLPVRAQQRNVEGAARVDGLTRVPVPPGTQQGVGMDVRAGCLCSTSTQDPSGSRRSWKCSGRTSWTCRGTGARR